MHVIVFCVLDVFFEKVILMDEYKFKKYDFDNPSFLFLFEDFLKNLLGAPLLYGPYIRSFGLNGNEKVLDFGCGSGIGSRCASKILGKGGKLTSIDNSVYWTKKAQKRLTKFTNVEIITGDIRALEIPDSNYDVIFIIHVIHDIDPVERQSIVSILVKKLKQNGIIFIRELIRKKHGMPIQEIQNLLSNAGLRELDSQISKTEYKGRYGYYQECYNP